LVRVPGHLTDAEAATLPCAGVTAWSAITAHARLKPGDSVVIQGTGGVSLLALQFALAHGVQTWLISSSDEKLEKARALGAHHTINYRTEPEWSGIVLEQTGGRGVDLVVDVAGGPTFTQSIAALTSNGRVSQVGIVGGFEATLPIYPLLVKAAHVDGIMTGSREVAEDMTRALIAHRIRPVVDRSFPLARLSSALRYLDSGSHFGKVVVDCQAGE
jgi:NADPH:quinone reductase-like Zn-dependent oxidoreductase